VQSGGAAVSPYRILAWLICLPLLPVMYGIGRFWCVTCGDGGGLEHH
jgi:hypothetical protein